jgi:PAS domain S-box-containing protein
MNIPERPFTGIAGDRARSETETRHRQIINSATDFGILSTDLQGMLVSWNEGAHRIFGWTEEEMLDQPVHRIFTPEDVAEGRPEIEMACALREGHATDERWHMRKGGDRFWASGELTPLKNNAEEAIGFVKILRDRTEQKRTEQDLKFLAQASAELGTLVDPQSTLDKLANLAVQFFADWCVIDLLQDDGTLKRLAAAHVDPNRVRLAQELMRRFPADPNAPHGAWNVMRTGQAELISIITEDILVRTFRNPAHLAAIRELGLRSYIGVPLSAHGKTLGVVSFICAESGRIYGLAERGLAEDLARRAAVAIENANLYRAIRQSDRGKDIFLATLAHELRNPLAAITNGLSIMKLAADDKQRNEQAARMMERQVGHLTRLVDDLMDVSRIATGKIELRKEHTNLASVLHAAVEASRPYMEQGNHKLSVTLPGSPAELFADPVRLTQVFSNLLHNAAKYTNPGGKIDVALECRPTEFIVRVADNGVGIAPDMLTKVFSIFAQVAHPLERSQGGLGIGLSLVDGLVRLHGGRVGAFSAGPDKGSEFVVHLPRTAEENLRSMHDVVNQPSGSSGEKARPYRILVVDDNVDAAVTVADILGMLGQEVAVVHDGVAAVAAAIEKKPDVVLLDIGLPGIDGYEAARRIRALENGADIVLIAITGWGQDADKQRAREAGFDQHWVKPVGLEQLRRIAMREPFGG